MKRIFSCLFLLKFSKDIPDENDSINIIVSMLGYKTQSLRTVNKSQQLKFLLEASEIILKEITVKAPNIRKQNDTQHYNVAGFKSAQDRYLGDVLKNVLIPVTSKITIFESKIDTKLGDWGGLAYNEYTSYKYCTQKNTTQNNVQPD